MGLLGTIIEAQRSLYQDGKEDKIFIVPLTMSYNFVLEAKFLIENYLQSTGREKYIKIKDQARSYRKFISFFWKLFNTSSEIYLSFAEPMDVFGHHIDEDGNSYNHLNQKIDLKEYFMINGSMLTNTQRESVYTKKLADKILDSYKRNNIILPSHLVAFCAFQYLKKQNPELDLFDLVNLNVNNFKIPLTEFYETVNIIWNQLLVLHSEQKASILEKHLSMEIEQLVSDGVNNLGIYHDKKPILIDNGFVKSQDLKLLYFYHNRMTHYDLNLNKEIQPQEALIFE